MNHKLLQMLNEAGFEFTPDIMNKLPAFENLVWLEREECAKVADKWQNAIHDPRYQCDCATAIRTRGQG